jgi:hypothetical protein
MPSAPVSRKEEINWILSHLSCIRVCMSR